MIVHKMRGPGKTEIAMAECQMRAAENNPSLDSEYLINCMVAKGFKYTCSKDLDPDDPYSDLPPGTACYE
jgi:hypothetical protein